MNCPVCKGESIPTSKLEQAIYMTLGAEKPDAKSVTVSYSCTHCEVTFAITEKVEV